jgi:hypothetical protein
VVHGVGVLVVILHPLTNITGVGVASAILYLMMVNGRLGLYNFCDISVWLLPYEGNSELNGFTWWGRSVNSRNTSNFCHSTYYQTEGHGNNNARWSVGFASLFDISVSLNDVSRGSWGRSPCSDPTAIDDKYRTWCRDNNNWPYNGNWSFGFA